MTGHHQPIRTCVACRQKGEKGQLIRFALNAEGGLVMDSDQILPGRGAYLCPDEECLLLAGKKNAFSRALRTHVRIPSPDALCKDMNRYMACKGFRGTGH